MLPRHSFVAFWYASCTAAVFLRRGSANDTAPYSNVTASATLSSIVTFSSPSVSSTISSSHQSSVNIDATAASSENGSTRSTGAASTTTPGPIILPNTTHAVAQSTYSASIVTINSTLESGPWPNTTRPWTNETLSASVRGSNATCTVHIPSASIDYWHPPTYSHLLGTMTTQFANFSKTDFYTLVTHTATFDPASALVSDYACTWSESYMSEYNYTATNCYDYTDIPTAASTTLVYRTAAAPFPPEGSIPVSDALSYDLYSEQPVATHPISIAPNHTFNQVSATPFVHFTAYEVESGNKTETIQLPSAYVYPYHVKGIEHETTASGPLPEEFLQQIPQADCDAGQLQATVTVVMVVDLYYQNWPNLDPFLVHWETTAAGFDDDPVFINNEATDAPGPFTMSDWDIPNVPAKPTSPVGIQPNIRPDPGPTQGDNNNNNNNNNQGAGSNEAQVPNIPQPTQVTVGNVGTIPVVIGPSSVVVVGSQTLQPGGPAVIVGGVTPVSLVPSATAVVVGGTTTLPLPPIFNNPAQEPARPPPVLTIGSSTLTPNAATQFFVAPGQTLAPGGTATIDGIVVSLGPSAAFVVVGGSTQFLPTAAPGFGPSATSPPQIVVGGTTITALPNQGVPGSNPGNNNNNNNNNNPNNNQNNVGSGPTFVIDGQTLAPGSQAITISGTTLSLAAGGSSIVVNGVTSAIANPPATFAQPTIVVGSSVFTPVPGSGSTFVIDGQTLAPGGQAVTVSGTTISLATSASFVVVNGATSTFANPAAHITPPALTIGNGVFRPLPGTGTSYQIGSLTLTPGGVITVADTTISLAPGATALVINGQTSLLTPPAQPVVTNAPLLTIGSQTYTAISGTTYIISGQTLTPGGTVVVDGTTISLAPGATQLVYGNSGRSTTAALFPATTTRSQSVTGTTSPSAGASGSNGQAAATSQRRGSASSSRVNGWLLSFFVTAFGLLLR